MDSLCLTFFFKLSRPVCRLVSQALFLCFGLTSFLLAGAQTINLKEQTDSPHPFLYEPITVVTSNSATGTINAASMFIAEQLVRNLNPDFKSRSLIVTDFVALNTLTETSQLGLLLAQNLMHEMQLRSWNVADVTFRRAVQIEPSGEFALSRDIKQLKAMPQVSSVITGTYVNTAEGLILNVRMIHVLTGNVISSAQLKLPPNSITTQLIDGPPKAPVLRVLAITN